MKIVTFNCNSIRSRMPILLKWLNEHEPDVLCLQETKVQDHDFPTEAFEGTGYNISFKGQKKYNGVAIFSKSAFEEVSFGLEDEPKDPARMINARINGISIVNTYIPQGFAPDSEKFEYKLNWFKRLGDFFEKHFKPTDKLIWLGDLNVAHQARDVHDPEQHWGHVCYCEQVQQALDKMLDWGLVDLFRKHHQEDGQYTFWDYRVPNGFRRNIGWRLDYIMATENLADKCTDCRVDTEPREAEKPSDHTFLVAEFKL